MTSHLATPTRILIIDDEPATFDMVSLGLRYEGFLVQSATTGLHGLELINSFAPHVIVLDLMLPDLDGIEVCQRARRHSTALIIMLTARDEATERVRGLEEGADDYLTKPFYFPELLARIRALMRRGPQPSADVYAVQDIVLNSTTREVLRAGRAVPIMRKEFDLLHLLLRHPNQVLLREAILNQVWGYNYMGDDNIIEVYVRYLRQKFDTDPPTLIRTVRGVGYILKV